MIGGAHNGPVPRAWRRSLDVVGHVSHRICMGVIRADEPLLMLLNPALTVEWFDPGTGRTVQARPVDEGGRRSLTAPFAGDAVRLCLPESPSDHEAGRSGADFGVDQRPFREAWAAPRHRMILGQRSEATSSAQLALEDTVVAVRAGTMLIHFTRCPHARSCVGHAVNARHAPRAKPTLATPPGQGICPAAELLVDWRPLCIEGTCG